MIQLFVAGTGFNSEPDDDGGGVLGLGRHPTQTCKLS